MNRDADAASTRVLLIEDRAEIRTTLESQLQAAGLQVVGAYATGEEALAAFGTVKADVALVDLGLPGLSGVETIRRMCAADPDVNVLVFTVFETADAIVQAIQAGAKGYLLKGAPMNELVRAIAQVRDGLTPISPSIAHHILEFVRRQQPPANPRYELSPRETEVLALLVRGHSYGSIAQAMGVRLGTVQGYVKTIYRKLEVASKAEATYLAVVNKLIPDQG